MTERIRIGEGFEVGRSHPSPEDLDRLARQGFKAVVNLRTEDEEDQPLSPQGEGEEVRRRDMEYLHFPVSPDALDASLVDRFREQVARLPRPVFVHCASGKRSGAMTMMHLAPRWGLSGEDALKKAEELGFECDSEDLERMVRRYIDEHREAAGG